MRQAAGCWRIPQPCTSEITTQHSSPKDYTMALLYPLRLTFSRGGFAEGVESLCVALILSRRC